MLFELNPEQYEQVAPLLAEQANHHILCAAVLAGHSEGRVLVDDPMAPRTAMAVRGDRWCFGGGDLQNEAFWQGLAAELAEPVIFPKLPGALFFNSVTPAWQGWLDGLVAGRRIIPMPRRLYQAEVGLAVGDVALPAGYQLHFIDEDLREQITGDLPGDISNVLKLRQGQAQPDGAAFGFAVIHDGNCVARAMVDYIVGDRGEIGLFTAPSHRQKRLGEATAAATIRYGLAHRLRLIDWDCTAFNVGSRRLAEKLELRLTAEYTQGWLIFSEVSYLVNWGFYAVDTGRYADALTWCEQTLAREHELAQQYGHYLAGVAQAGLGEPTAALTHLQAAAEAGFNELAELSERPELRILHEQAAWPALLTRIGQNLG